MKTRVACVFNRGALDGSLAVAAGKVTGTSITVGKGHTSSRGFCVTSDGACRIEADIEAEETFEAACTRNRSLVCPTRRPSPRWRRSRYPQPTYRERIGALPILIRYSHFLLLERINMTVPTLGTAAIPRFNFAAPPLLPLRAAVDVRGVLLTAGGVTLRFDGVLVTASADGPVEIQSDRVQPGDCPAGLITFEATVHAEHPVRLRTVTWFAGAWEPGVERAVQSTAFQDGFLFLRKEGISFFLSLDFPYSRIDDGGISYPPQTSLQPDAPYAAHSLTVAACRLSGVRVGAFDRAEIEAASAYVEQRHPPRFERPMHISACITNRMTDCRENRVFYSMHDNPTLALNPRLLAEDVRLMAEIGVEYFQVFEGVFDWPDQRRTGAALRRLVRLGRRLGVRIGDYVNPQGLYCPHYNYSHRSLDRPEWLIRTAEGHTAGYCLGNAAYTETFVDRLVEHDRRYGLECIVFDFLNIQPCYATDHGHDAGDVYCQILALLRLFEKLNALSPDYLIWSNSGCWHQLMPKLAWWNPNIYLTDPHVRGYEPTLNALKLLGDGRREQMVTTHETTFTPYRFFTNCEYYAFPRSREPDVRVFEYSFLQGLAVTPNICPAEVRTFFNRVPGPARAHCAAFMRRWMDFTRRHFEVWKHTYRVGDAPGPGATEIYAHIAGDHGFVCLVNQNPYPRRARFALDRSIGLAGGGPYEVVDVYPRQCPIAEQPLPCCRPGESLAFHLPPYSVRFLEIRPWKASGEPRFFGLPATVRKIRGGYRATLRAPQGERVVLGLALPAGETAETVSARQKPSVPMYTFPASARLLEQAGSLARIEVVFPRTPAPRALTAWRIQPGDVAVDLPASDGAGFLGARISGVFSEDLDVCLDIRTCAADPDPTAFLPARMPPERQATSLPAAPRQVFETDFELPFIEPTAYGCMPGWDDDTIVDLSFADPARIASIEAAIDGQPIEVRKYRYPRGSDWISYYLELTGAVNPGAHKLTLTLDWK